MPNPTSESIEKKRSMKPWVIIVGVIVVAGLAWLGYSFYRNVSVNYAEEVAKPLEEGLVKAGGIRQCSSGDAGRGSDNRSPWHNAVYMVPASETETINLMARITKENGYNLTHANPSNKGPVPVIDEFVDKWHFDNTSKMQPYHELQDGSITLFVLVNASGLASACPEPLMVDAQHSAVRIDVQLPEFKSDARR